MLGQADMLWLETAMEQMVQKRVSGAQIDLRIDEFEEQINIALEGKRRVDWGEVWDVVKSINALFRQAWYPSWEQRQASWDRFQHVVGRVKKRGEELKTRTEVFPEQYADVGHTAQQIVVLAQRAWPHEDGFAEFLGTITGAKLLAEGIGAGIEGMAHVLTFGLLRQPKSDNRWEFLKECSAKLREAWELYRDHRDAFGFEERQCLRDLLSRVQAKLDGAWATLKAQQQEKQLERTNWKRELIAAARDLMTEDPAVAGVKSKELTDHWKAVGFVGDKVVEEDLWLTFRLALDTFWERRRATRKDRMEQAREAIQANIDKLQSSIEHDEGVLDDKKTKLDNVHDGRRADEIRDHLQLAISSLEEKLQRKKGWIQEQEEQIADIERTLDGIR
jgi:hypothetical protein